MKTKNPAKIALVLAISALLFWLPAGLAGATVGGPGGGSSSSSSSSGSGSGSGSSAVTNQEIENNLRHNPIIKDIQTIVDFLSAGVAVVVVAMIITGGIQYSIAGDNTSAVTAAKKRITNALIALFAFIFLFAFVQWLIPGGIFG